MRPGAAPTVPLALLTAAVAAAHLLALRTLPAALTPGDEAAPRAAPLLTRRIEAPSVTPPTAATAPAPAARPRAAKHPQAAAPAALAAAATDSGSKEASPSAERSSDALESVAMTSPQAAAPAQPASAPAAPETVASVAPTAPPAPPAPAEPAEPAAPAQAAFAARVPPPARLLYDVSGQIRQLPYTARGELLWRHDGQRYTARLEVSAFLMGARVQTSEGDLASQGLAPRRFGDKSRHEQAAHFDRDTGRIRFSANTPEAALLPGAQDRLSLFLQLGALLAAEPARWRPGTSLTLQTASAREAEPWRVRVGERETLSLPAGSIEAVHLVREPRREYDVRVEVWIAPALDHLPVRIRLTQANGDVVDQQLRAREAAP
jgi:hypothetical protein